MWFSVVILLGVLLLIPTAYAGLIGAPYAPTRRAVVTKAFQALNVSSADTVVDLGAGDGKIVFEAARFGAHGIGYELSPIMWAIAWVRSWGRKNVHIRWGNFYKKKLPRETSIIFTFLMPEKMPRLKQYLQEQELPRGKFLVSYMFPLADVDPLHVIREPNCGAIYVYQLSSLREEATKRVV